MDDRKTTTVTAGDRDDALARALQQIADGEADTLHTSQLSAAAGSLRQLIRLLDWLEAAGATLLADDVALDTSTAGGRRMVALLREIERWDRVPRDERPGRGRPGLTTGSPHLAERIAALRQQGLSLNSIAETLNAEGVPTPRGGQRWRPSSVQAALGYQRPRPPVPGLPPAGPKGKGPKGKGPKGKGPSGEGPKGKGPRVDGPKSEGPKGKGPKGDYPKTNDPKPKGPKGNGPKHHHKDPKR